MDYHPNIPHEVYTEILNTLINCGMFEDDSRVRALFSDPRIKPWQNHVPDSSVLHSRVEKIVSLLLNKYRADTNENALVLLIKVLRDRVDINDKTYTHLSGIVNILEENIYYQE